MTAARTPSQRGAANRRKGHQAERDLAKWLRSNGFPHAERAVRTGFRTLDRVSADPGDITGTIGIVWSVKDVAVEHTAMWLDELDAMASDTDGATVGLLVHKRRGHASPERWWCWIRYESLIELAVGSTCTGCAEPFPIRMELGHAVQVLRHAGYGDPIAREAAS